MGRFVWSVEKAVLEIDLTVATAVVRSADIVLDLEDVLAETLDIGLHPMKRPAELDERSRRLGRRKREATLFLRSSSVCQTIACV